MLRIHFAIQNRSPGDEVNSVVLERTRDQDKGVWPHDVVITILRGLVEEKKRSKL